MNATPNPASSSLKPGLVSVTFRRHSAEEVIRLAIAAGLHGIEWGGDVHVPHGNLEVARRVGELTRAAGLAVIAYGSYFRLGNKEANDLQFATVLKTAQALGTDLIRIWAGDRNPDRVSASGRQALIAEAQSIGTLAEASGIRMAFEFHADSLTNTAAATQAWLEAINHSNVQTFWQPEHGLGAARNISGLKLLLPWIAGVHVFHWWPTPHERHPLDVGAQDWSRYLAILQEHDVQGFASLEFLKDDAPDQLRLDAQTLRGLLNSDIS